MGDETAVPMGVMGAGRRRWTEVTSGGTGVTSGGTAVPGGTAAWAAEEVVEAEAVGVMVEWEEAVGVMVEWEEAMAAMVGAEEVEVAMVGSGWMGEAVGARTAVPRSRRRPRSREAG
jgi:uncharacterized protein (DUF2235 family)